MFPAAPLTPQPALLPVGGLSGQPTPLPRNDDVASFAKLLNASAPPAQPAPPPAPAAATAPVAAKPPAPGNESAPRTETRNAANTPRKADDGAPKGQDGKTTGKDGTDKRDDATTASAETQAVEAEHKDEAASDDAQDSVDEFTSLLGLSQQALARPDPTTAHGAAAHARASGEAATDPAQDADTGRDGNARAEAASRSGRLLADSAAGRVAQRSSDAADAARDARQTRTDASQQLLTDASRDATPLAAQARLAATGAAGPTAGGTPETSFAAQLGKATAGVAAADAPSAGTKLQAPLHSAAFASELGTRVSLLAVNGTQQAELQLNPAEMGPVTVQIVVDGSQAQVSFHAAQAETRQALERSLPDLAAALQGSGLTLSGGGVFQQQAGGQGAAAERDGRGTESGGHARSQGATGVEPVTVSAPAAARRTGLLDTFA